MFVPIQKIITKAVAKLGIQKEATAALVCEKYRRLAPRLVHTNALEHTFPKSFAKKTLTIGVLNSAWAAEVKKNETILLETLNEALGKKSVAVIRTSISETIPAPINF